MGWGIYCAEEVTDLRRAMLEGQRLLSSVKGERVSIWAAMTATGALHLCVQEESAYRSRVVRESTSPAQLADMCRQFASVCATACEETAAAEASRRWPYSLGVTA